MKEKEIQDKPSSTAVNRKCFIKGILAAGAAPVIVPASVLGKDAPSNKIAIGAIGLGARASGDVPEFSMSEETDALNEALENAVDDLDRAVGAARISEIVESTREVLEDHVDRIREVLVFLKSFKEEEE